MHTRRLFVVTACLLLSLAGTAAAQPDGSDILVRSGTVVATTADYEMDGTMWVAFTLQEDRRTYLYRSTDHGLSWEWRGSIWPPSGQFEKLELVVGEGDSGFMHLFHLDPRNNGDLRDMRFPCDSGGVENLPVLVGPDTIRDFAACRDYSGSNYWLYAVVTNPDTIPNNRALRFVRSSTYGREWAVTDSYAVQVIDPHLSAGAGSYLYFACVSPFWMGGSVVAWISRLWLTAGYWETQWWSTDSQEVHDPVIGAAFTMPESLSTAWCVYSQNYHNSGDWDMMYSYTTGHSINWSQPAFLDGSSAADEQYPDLRNYTSPGNQYINVSYISDDNMYRSVYRRYAQATTPDQWSDTLRINEGSAGTGSEIRPKLCYTPGGPFSGAGCVFVGAGLNGCWWNGPYPTGVETPEKATAATGLDVRPSIGRGPFRVCCQEPTADIAVHDRAGRLVRTLTLDPAGVATWDGTGDRGRQLADGVYFVRETQVQVQAVRKIVVTR